MKLILFLLLCSCPALAQSIPATTADGRKVTLNLDGTWKYADATASAGYSEKQQAAIKAAVLALRKLSDVTVIGVTYRDYKTKLADSKNIIEDAVALLPQGETRKQLMDAWSPHIKAVQWWDTMLNMRSLRVSPKEREDLKKELPKIKMEALDSASREEILSACWAEAAEQLQPLIKLAASFP